MEVRGKKAALESRSATQAATGTRWQMPLARLFTLGSEGGAVELPVAALLQGSELGRQGFGRFCTEDWAK